MQTHLNKNMAQKAKRFASQYEQFAEVEREISRRLLERLDLMKIKPMRVLDFAARTGFSTRLLRKRYPQAQVVACDWSHDLLAQTPRRFWQKHKSLVVANESLPFQSRCFDLIVANLAQPWVSDREQVLREFYRLLNPNGLLLFTSVGPDTLCELQQVAAGQNRVHQFTDMHNIGDLLYAVKFVDPVMDMEYLTLHYPCVAALFKELRGLGVSNTRADQQRGLQGKQQWQKLLDDYQQQFGIKGGNGVRSSLELVYGHAWMPQAPDLQGINQEGEVVVPLSALKRTSC